MKEATLLILMALAITFSSCNGDKKDPDPKDINTANWEPVSTSPIASLGFSAGDPSALHLAGESKPWRLWFGYARFITNDARAEIGYAESADGITWEVAHDPVLETSEAGGWDHKTAEVPTVIYDEGESDPGKRFKMWYSGRNTHDLSAPDFEYGIGHAYSPDGKEWTKLPAGQSPYQEEGLILKADYIDKFPGIPVHVSEPEVIKNGSNYEMWHVIWGADSSFTEGVEAYVHSISSDGITWTPNTDNLIQAAGEDEVSPHGGIGQVTVIRSGSEYEIWYSVEKENNEESLEHTLVRHLTSSNGFSWGKPATVMEAKNEAPFWLGPGIDVVQAEGKKYLFYSGFQQSTANGFNLYLVKEK